MPAESRIHSNGYRRVRVLITGIGGFVGSHMCRYLLAADAGAEIHGTVIDAAPAHLPASISFHTLDLQQEAQVAALLADLRPDRIYQFAASAIVHQSFDRPWQTLENNIRIPLNLILGCLEAGIAPRILLITSGEVYGSDQAADKPTSEDAPMRPANPYSVSKVTQDMLGLQYYLSHRLPIIRARPFNHLGPGQNPGFVAPDFARQIARIEAGQQPPVMKVGDLSAERDFTDVRDIVRAYYLLMERGEPGEAYNVASEKTCSIQHLLDILLSYTSVAIDVQSNANMLRHRGVQKSWGSAAKLRNLTGWRPEIPLETTLRDVLEDWRHRVRQPA